MMLFLYAHLFILPGASVFELDMLVHLPQLIEWMAIGHEQQCMIKNATDIKSKCIYHDHAIRDKMFIVTQDIDHKVGTSTLDIPLHTRTYGMSFIGVTLLIRRDTPPFEQKGQHPLLETLAHNESNQLYLTIWGPKVVITYMFTIKVFTNII